MRTSCNACRVLRKGCSDDCSLRPCLDWIRSSDSQSNATIFLAKFYGRAGLLNLVNAGPDHLPPAIFRSLLYEACGRVINPVSGSVGLLCSSNWDKCQAAVDSVLNGSPLIQLDDSPSTAVQPFKPGCDIRHLINKRSHEILPVQTRSRFKHSSNGRGRSKSRLVSADELKADPTRFSISGWVGNYPDEANGDPSHHHSSTLFSVETVEASLANRVVVKEESDEVDLELYLGFNQVLRNHLLPTVEEHTVVH